MEAFYCEPIASMIAVSRIPEGFFTEGKCCAIKKTSRWFLSPLFAPCGDSVLPGDYLCEQCSGAFERNSFSFVAIKHDGEPPESVPVEVLWMGLMVKTSDLESFRDGITKPDSHGLTFTESADPPSDSGEEDGDDLPSDSGEEDGDDLPLD